MSSPQSEAVYYRDTRVSPNSALYAALMDARNTRLPNIERKAAQKRAEAIYNECETEYARWNKPIK